MKMILAGAVLALLAGAAAAEPIDTKDIIAAATGDFNKDDTMDLVLMTRGTEYMDLHFFLADAQGGFLKQVDVARNKVWGRAGADEISGQQPDIKALANGSIQVITHNDSIGRDRWSQTLTLAYRNTDFVVAGFTYSYYDTLDLNNTGQCDLNVLTGKGVASKPDGKGGSIDLKISAPPQFAPFKDWSDDAVLKACGIGG